MWLYRILYPSSVLGIYWRLRLTGAVDKIPREGPLIVASNHTSFLDPWLLPVVFPRPIHWLITDKWYYKSKLWKLYFDAFGTVPLRSRDPRGTIEAVREMLAQGKVCGIFPEGRISYDGRIQRFQSGVSRIAGVSGAPILPVGVRGSFESLPRTRRIPRPSRITFHVGEPLVFPGSPHVELPDFRDFQQEVFEQVCKLAGQEDRIKELASGSSRWRSSRASL